MFIKFILSVILLPILSLSSCAPSSAQPDKFTDTSIGASIVGLPNISSVTIQDKSLYPSNALGDLVVFEGIVMFSVPEVDDGDVNTDSGGSIEILQTEKQAEARNAYLSVFDGGILDSGSHKLYKNLVIRVSTYLPKSEQDSITDSIIKAIS